MRVRRDFLHACIDAEGRLATVVFGGVISVTARRLIVFPALYRPAHRPIPLRDLHVA
jgi:hypothetical protein